jgi:hypothetical protein
MDNFVCGFCSKQFRSEKTLTSHMCPTKRRYADQNSVASRMGLQLYRRFYDLNAPGREVKSFDDFARSRYYSSFIHLARHLMDFEPIDKTRFIDYLFQNGIKEKHWCQDQTYEKYLIDLLLKESPEKALERSIMAMEKWATQNQSNFTEFFKKVTTPQAVHMIRYGHISPWVLYLASSADELWNRMSSEQGEILSAVIDPHAWRVRFETRTQERQFVKGLLDEAGL